MALQKQEIRNVSLEKNDSRISLRSTHEGYEWLGRLITEYQSEGYVITSDTVQTKLVSIPSFFQTLFPMGFLIGFALGFIAGGVFFAYVS